jgi:hypothetical protein
LVDVAMCASQELSHIHVAFRTHHSSEAHAQVVKG